MNDINSLFIRGLSIDWSRIERRSYLRRIESLNGLETLELKSPVTFFVGENESGKSTLLEAIAIAYGFNPEGGTWNYRFSTYDSHSRLCDAIRLQRGARKPDWGYFLRAESFYNVATKEEEYSDEAHPSARLHEKSHGESFLVAIERQLRPESLYIFDEPEAALSPQRQLSVLYDIHECVKQGSQFIIATHSPILLGLPDAGILSFDDGAIRPCAYEDTGSYQITSMFINSRERMLRNLLDDIV